MLGRTNTPEFAGEFVTEPTWRGATQKSLEPEPQSRRIERRRGRGGGIGHGAHRPRHGFGRFDPRARRRLRARGLETQPRLGAGGAAAG